MALPNFFIVGAPKCGTTSLARWLGEHPHIFFSRIKEPHYYSTDLSNRSIINFKDYQRLFRDVRSTHSAVGEGSTWYLFSNVAIPKIERYNSSTRYIVMTRDPIEMAHSLFHHNRRVLHENQMNFEKAWALQQARRHGRDVPRTCSEPNFLQYKEACALGSQLRRIVDNVSPQRILHISLTDMRHDPAAQYQRALAFLSVQDDGRRHFPVANVARGHRSAVLQRLIRFGGRLRLSLGIQKGLGLAQINEMPFPKKLPSEQFSQYLSKEFESEIALLEEMTVRLAPRLPVHNAS